MTIRILQTIKAFRLQPRGFTYNILQKPLVVGLNVRYNLKAMRSYFHEESFDKLKGHKWLWAAGIGLSLLAADNVFNERRLYRAIQNGNIQEVRKYIGNDKSLVDQKHTLGWTPIMAAVANNQPDIVIELLRLGASTDLQDQYSSPGVIANQKGMHPIEVLQRREDEFCPSMNGRASFLGWTALHYAALANSERSAKALLEAGADPTLRDHAGRRALHYAIENSPVQQLLKSHITKWEKQLAEKAAEERRRFPLEQRLKQFIVGQQSAINIVAAAIRRKENGWADEEHPLVFLFLGSSGIGKTELAKQLARYIHADDPNAFIRLDMSEYQEKHEVAKLIGAPPGYVGHEDGGQLTRHLAKRSDAVVLFDEVDKAHPDVLTVLLQLFDEGRLTDGKGKLIECKNAIFVMTSNLAADEIAEYGMELRKEAERINALKMSHDNKEVIDESAVEVSKNFKDHVVRPILKAHFCRDEFLGRINEIVYFLPFSRQELLTLVAMELSQWAKKASSRHGVELRWEGGVLGALADGYDVHYGARSIKHHVERRVVNQIALAAENGLLCKGSSILLTTEDGKIHLNIKKPNEKNYKLIS